MYIQKIKIENIKSIDNLEIDFGNSHSGWHVILGENGSGKSTLLKSIAIALISEGQIGGILPVWKDWLRNGEKNGKIELIIDNMFDTITLSGIQKHNLKVEMHYVNGKYYLKKALERLNG